MSTSKHTGGDAVVTALEGFDVPIVFGVASVHNLPILDALSGSPIRFVPTRTEAGAVNMADAYSRVSGGVGVAITSTGPGAANAAGALVEAQAASSRVLHITSEIESDLLDRGLGGIHETQDQLGMLTAISKFAVRAERGLVGESIVDAMSAVVEFPQGPASVEIPIDVQYGHSGVVQREMPEPSRMQPDVTSVRAAVDVLESARRPAVWAGGGVNSSGAGVELLALVEKTAAALFTSNKGRGAVSEEHPQCVGNFANHPEGAAFLRDCDVLLSVGTHLRSIETNGYKLELPETHIQIDVNHESIGRAFRSSLGITGDAKATLALMNSMLERAVGAEAYRAEVASLKARIRESVRQGLGHYAKLADALRTHVTPGMILARDVTVLAHLIANRLHPIQEARANLFAVGAGIGQGLAMAIGAEFACSPARVVLLAGDGGLACNVGEMATATQERLRPCVVLLDDGGYGILRAVQDASFAGRRVGVDLRGPAYGRLAEAMGWGCSYISDADEFDAVLADGLKSSRPNLIVADLAAIGELAEPVVRR